MKNEKNATAKGKWLYFLAFFIGGILSFPLTPLYTNVFLSKSDQWLYKGHVIEKLHFKTYTKKGLMLSDTTVTNNIFVDTPTLAGKIAVAILEEHFPQKIVMQNYPFGIYKDITCWDIYGICDSLETVIKKDTTVMFLDSHLSKQVSISRKNGMVLYLGENLLN